MSAQRRRNTIPRAVVAAVVIAALASASGQALERRELDLPGPSLRLAASGGGAWALAGTTGAATRTLVALRWPAGTFTTVSRDVPAALDRLLPANGDHPALLAGDGSAATIASGTVTPLALPDARAPLGGELGTIADAPPFLALATLGQVRVAQLDGDALRAGAATPLPVIAARKTWGIELTTPRLRFAGLWLAVGPQQEGRLLRTSLVGAHGERIEARSLLPAGEQVAESEVVWLADRAVLVVGSFRGLGIASRKQLRVFALDASDSSRAGNAPAVALELAARAWQDLTVTTGDVNGDGRDDLLVLAPSGLTDHGVSLTAFLTRGDGRLAATPVTGDVDVGGAQWRCGDFDGDHRPDLLTLDGGTLALRRGGVARGGLPTGKPLVLAELPKPEENAPTHEVDVTVGGDAAAKEKLAAERRDLARGRGWDLLDLDGDGASEVVLWTPTAVDRLHLTIVGH